MILAMPSLSIERAKCFGTLLTLEVTTTVGLLVPLQSLLVLVALPAHVTFVLSIVN